MEQGFNPSSRTMGLASTQPLIEMSTRIMSWEVKVAGAYLRLLTVQKFWSLKLFEP